MGNKQGRNRTNYTDYNDPEQPFNDLPTLWGPLNGYYYHIKDKDLANLFKLFGKLKVKKGIN